ncbi:MAG: hypothetical protein JWP74_4176 [Marmoricola sp.]|nr:hypothetical protein [Marmoricola sp.]
MTILINGVELKDWARTVEEPHALAEGNQRLAGSYSPLATYQFNDDLNHFLGHPVAAWFDDGDTVLLGCECGEWGCWPLTTLVEVNAETVRWHGFRNGHRDWDLSGLGPFRFSRDQYESALVGIGSH